MCGIVYYKDFRGHDVTQRVKARFKAQRQRGTEGFGYYIPATDRLTHNPQERRLLDNLLSHKADEVLFHHRFPTSTPNVQNACHPFSTNANKELFKHNYVLVHNGYLSNDYDLQDEHERLGIKYVSDQPNGQFNDSEALLYDVALYLEGKQDKLQAKGAIAFVVIERDETGTPVKLHWGRNAASPLMLSYKPGKVLSLASEGKGIPVPTQQLHTFDYATGIFSVKSLEINDYEYKSVTKDYFSGSHPADEYDFSGGYDPMTKHYKYNFYTHDGDHWEASTNSEIADSLCHAAGEVCPKLITTKRDDRMIEYVEMTLNKAEWNTEDALELTEYELAQAKTRRRELEEQMAILDDSTEETAVNDYIGLLDEYDLLKRDIATMDKAANHLSLLLDQQQYDAAQLQLEAGIVTDVPEGKPLNEVSPR